MSQDACASHAVRLAVLNPNASTTMTEQVTAALRSQAQGLPWPIALRGLTAAGGPPVVATRASFVQGAAAALQTWQDGDDGWADALLLACFGDPGLAALREVSRVPVLGMAESALSVAVSLHRPFHIITAGAPWDAMLRETLQLHPGAMRWFDGITLLDTTGRAIANDPQSFLAQVQAAVDGLAARHQPTCILGGAGFAPLLPQIRYPGTLVDGLGAALQQLAALRLP